MLLIILIFSCFLSSNLFCSKIISNAFNYSNNPFFYFLAEKNTKKGYILKVDNLPNILKKIDIIVGEIPGNKFKKGDKKTPEGIYFIQRFIPPSHLSKKYGLGAYVLNYPNIVDRIFHKSGYGIWIHGVPDNVKKEYTQGCIASYDRNLKKITTYLNKKIPVVITKKALWLDINQYKNLKLNYYNFFNKYLLAWENGNFPDFSKYYNKNFPNLKGYLLRKKRLFKKIKYRKITPYHIKILLKNKKEFLVEFNQFYCAINLLAYGEKKLYFEDKKIIAEKYFDIDGRNIVKKEILKFIERWKKSWESRDFKQYKKFYSKNFYQLDSFLKDKQQKFKKYKFIKIEIKKIKFNIISPTRYKVIFIQRFKSDKYSDYGIKTLILENCPGDFKIRREMWKKI